MAYDGWVEFGGVEVVNLSRTVQLADALGIDTVWITRDSVDWIPGAVDGVDYDTPSAAPWYDSRYIASQEFAGIIPLSLAGLDDSTLESTAIEYTTDGGSPGMPRSKTLPIVANVALVASSDRGAEYGLRWLNHVLRYGEDRGQGVACSGKDLRYFRFAPDGTEQPEQAYRRNVRLTRGTSVTRKRSNSCSATWLVTFTWTAADPYEYSDPIPVVSDLGDPDALFMANGLLNMSDNPFGLASLPLTEYQPRYSWTRSFLTSGLANPDMPTVNTAVRITAPAAGTAVSSRGIDIYANLDAAPPTDPGANKLRLLPGQTVTVGAYVRSSVSLPMAVGFRINKIGVAWAGPLTLGPSSNLSAGTWSWVEHSITLPRTANPFDSYAVISSIRSTSPVDIPSGGTMDFMGLRIAVSDDGPVSTREQLVSGSVTLIETSCPQFDYTPIYDPQFPALLAPPTAPDFYPDGWLVADGSSFDRFWAVIPPTAPSTLSVVPRLTISSESDARMVRFSLWEWTGDAAVMCDPLWSVTISYLPAFDLFTVDGVQKAAYVWDGQSPEVRRADSLVYGPDATPLDWASFTTETGLLATLDIFSESDIPDGGGTVRAELQLVRKSD